MYQIDAGEDWFLKKQHQQREHEDEFLRLVQKFRTLMDTQVYKDVREHVMSTFIHQTPKIPINESGPLTAFAVYNKQEGLRFFFDYVENTVKEGERRLSARNE